MNYNITIDFERYGFMKIKVTSYNIFHCADYYNYETIDYDAFIKTIDSFSSAVVGMNEVHGEGPDDEYDEQAEILGKGIGCNYYFSKATEIDGNNPFGNAMLSRLPVKEVSTIPIPDPEPKSYDGYYETRAVLRMVTDTTPEITFLITHFGLNPDEQENAVKTVLANLPKERCVFMGDLNVMPDNEVLNPIKEVLKDTAVEVNNIPLTFPSCEPNRKIDYIFVTPDIKVNSFFTEDIVLSDHLAVSAEIEVE